MLKLFKTVLFVISILQFFISQVTAANGTCEKITSTECPDFPSINALVNKEVFDSNVQKKYEELKNVLTAGDNTCDADINAKVRYLKSMACAFVIKDQGCSGSTSLCPDICTEFGDSVKGISCVDTEKKSSIFNQCSLKTVQSGTCLLHFELELGTCGFEDASSKANFCAKPENSETKCCKSNAPAPVKTPTKSTNEKVETKPKEHTQEAEEEKKKGGSFFTSKVFIVISILIILIIAVLGYFYYVGSKEEKEERFRNLEEGNNGYMESYYHGGNESKSRDISYSYGNDDYNLSGNNYNYHKKLEDENPFDDSNRIDTYSRRISNIINGDDDEGNEISKKAFNPFEQSYNDVQNNTLLAAPPDVHNPFDSPKFEEDSIINNFPTPVNKDVDKIKKDDTNANATAPTTKPETTYIPNIPKIVLTDEKDINIGDDVLKPSVVTLTEIKSPEENNIKDEKEIETPKEPQKGMVNMIDIKKPSSSEVVKTNNGLTPSILITNENGDVSSIDPEESITEEYSEMPEPKPFRAIHAYEPQIEDELRLEVDNEIDVLYEYDDGWCWAINKTTGEQGACPLLCLISAREAVFGDHGWEKDMEIVQVPGRRESMLSFDSSNMSFSQMSLQRKQKLNNEL